MSSMDQHQQQFKCDIERATSVVHCQLTRLRTLNNKFSAIETNIRRQIELNIKSGNNSRAKALAVELSNIRNVQRTSQNGALALEIMLIRFSTITEFAIVMETITPTIGLIRDIQKDISKVIPAASSMLSEMKMLTTDVLCNSAVKSDIGSNISAPVDQDALSILNEVEGILENEAKAKLPEVPTTVVDKRANKEILDEETHLGKTRIMIEG
jgi:division protein CdvB (Snf7/Vps24/ESCRT-III family)